MKSEKEKSQKRKPNRIYLDGYIQHGGLSGMFYNIFRDIRRNKAVYLIVLLVMTYFVIFNYIPMVGILMAFQKYSPIKGFFKSRWIGMKNFTDFFGGPYAARLIRNTALLGVLDTVINFPAPIIFALMLNEIRGKKFKKVIQTTSYLPHFISSVVVCGMIRDFTNTGGVISEAFKFMTNGTSMNLLSLEGAFRPIYILSGMWQGIGYGSIIYLASLSSIDQELYEAAVVDGASRWKQTIHITIPGIMPTVILMLIMRMGGVFNVGADKILNLYSPVIYETADVINTYVYRVGIAGADYGLSTAVGLFNSIIGTIMLVTTNAISRKVSETSMF